MRVFAVWEPILPSDWMRPTAGVLGRIADARVTQFWDPGHVVAGLMARRLEKKPECCERKGILWDLAAVYAPGAVWEDGLPPASYMNGPVVRVSQ